MNDAPSMAELGFRLVGSLAVVVGLLLLIARTVNRRFKAPAGATVQVVCRQQLSRGTQVAVVSVGTRVLVVGTTEHQVSLLAEMDPEELLIDDPTAPAIEPRFTLLDDDAVAASNPGSTTRWPDGDAVPAPGLAPVRGPGYRKATVRPLTPALTRGAGPLAGSMLSAQTWKQTLAFFTNHPPPEHRHRAS